MLDDDEPDPTKREGPVRKAWLAPTVGADSVAPAPRDTIPPSLSISVFDPPEQRFVEKSELGRGGMGRVVEAVDRALGRSVAIKQSLATSAVDLARFEREVRITARLQHPSVIPILDVGRDPEGHPFYIMRKIEGDPLADRVMLAETVRDRLALVSSFLGAVDAAAYAHAKRIIHRDIKPWNILLGPFGETLLIDWGIARELDVDGDDPSTLGAADTGVGLTRLGVAQGTPGFLAPEQARGEVVDARADVFSLGATLFYILANKLPYGRISATEAIDLAAEGKPPDFAMIPEEVPRELLAILVKSMAALPADRYVDAGELAADLRRFLAGQLVAAHEYTTRERIAKWVRQHRIAVTVSALALLVVAVVGIVSLRQVFHDRDAAETASAEAIAQADENLLQRVRSLIETDPTSAIAVLRELREDSPQWEAARGLTRVAIRGGIERRVAVHTSHVTGIAFSPDGKWLASGSQTVMIHAVPGGATRTLATAEVFALTWWGPRVIAFIGNRGGDKYVKLADIDTGVFAELPTTDTPQELIAIGERLYVRGKTTVVAFTREREKIIIADNKIQDMAAGGGVLVAAAGTALTIVDASGTRTISIPPRIIGGLAVAADGSAVATLGDGLIREWKLAALDDSPREWKRPAIGTGDLDYVGHELIAWNSEGTGFVSLSNDQPLWTTSERSASNLTNHILPFDGGAALLTDSGSFAIRTAQGTVALPHRPVGVTRADIARDGRMIALGLNDGAVMLGDLGHALPKSFPVVRSAELAAYAGDRIVMAGYRNAMLRDEAAVESGHVLQVTGVTLFQPETGELLNIPSDLTRVLLYGDDQIILGARAPDAWVWNTRGELLFQTKAHHIRIDNGVVYWLDSEGGVWSRAVKPLGPATKILQLPASVHVVGGAGDGEFANSLRIFGDLITISLTTKTGATRSVRITPAGLEPIELPPGDRTISANFGGVWWTRDRTEEQALWRADEKIPLGHRVSQMTVVGDHVWVIGDRTFSVVDVTGKVLRQFPILEASLIIAGDAAFTADLTGIMVVVPAANLQSRLRVSGRVMNVAVSRDGKRIAAMTEAPDGARTLMHWTDPVPDDPKALRAYLGTLTNAHLQYSAYALSWD